MLERPKNSFLVELWRLVVLPIVSQVRFCARKNKVEVIFQAISCIQLNEMRMVARAKFLEDGFFFLELTFALTSGLEECFDSYSWMLFLHKLSKNNKQQTHR